METALKAFSEFLYPPFCLHCDHPLDDKAKLLCVECLVGMQLVDPQQRCGYCFSEEIGSQQLICPSCLVDPPLWHGLASALDYQGPAVSLIKAFKYGGQPYLSKGIASYMAAQFIQMNWPLPDIIVPVPIPMTRWFQRGYNQSLLLAEELGKIIDKPVKQPLKRKSGDFSQAALSGEMRRTLSSDSFYVKESSEIEDRVVLLIDDVMTTGSTLKCCTEVLYEQSPQSIYVLTGCRAIQ